MSASQPMQASREWMPPHGATRDRAIWFFFTLQLLAMTVFQKIGLPVGGIAVSISVPLMWGGLAVLALRGWAKIDVLRLLLFSAFVFLSMAGLVMVESFSFSSLALVAAIYIPMIFTVRISEELYLRGLRLFVNLALLTVPIIFLQWGLQYAIRPGLWFNIETIVPKSFLVPDYFYERLVSYGSAWTKPNGIFFLEVSILSQILALAVVIELVCFRDVRRALVLVAGLISTTAGTGAVLLALCVPFLLRYLSPRVLVAGIIFGIFGILIVLANGIPSVFNRLSEFSSQTESGYYRFVAPFFVLGEMFDGSSVLWQGAGPGNAPKALIVMLPFTKLVYEYGFIASVFFYAFLIVSMFRGAYSFVISFAVFVFYNLLGGGLAVPFYGEAVIVLTTLFRVAHEHEEPLRRSASQGWFMRYGPGPGAQRR